MNNVEIVELFLSFLLENKIDEEFFRNSNKFKSEDDIIEFLKDETGDPFSLVGYAFVWEHKKWLNLHIKWEILLQQNI